MNEEGVQSSCRFSSTTSLEINVIRLKFIFRQKTRKQTVCRSSQLSHSTVKKVSSFLEDFICFQTTFFKVNDKNEHFNCLQLLQFFRFTYYLHFFLGTCILTGVPPIGEDYTRKYVQYFYFFLMIYFHFLHEALCLFCSEFRMKGTFANNNYYYYYSFFSLRLFGG